MTDRYRPSTELLELRVDQYKNLSSVCLPWQARTVLFGRNGSGKTNLLEALALCLGSETTLWHLAPRTVEPRPGAISVVLRTTPSELPLAPAYCVGPAAKLQPGATDPFSASASFWHLLDDGEPGGSTWAEGIERAVAQPQLVDLLAEAGARPSIRYSLDRIEGLARARSTDRGHDFREGGHQSRDIGDLRAGRWFRRTLVLEGTPPDWLIAIAGQLPDAFAPLRRWLSEPAEIRSPYADLLGLPDATWIPASAVWLPAERTTSEALADLYVAFERAERPALQVTAQFDRLRDLWAAELTTDDRMPGIEGDAKFWLAVEAEKVATQGLQLLTPNLSLLAEDSNPGSLNLIRTSGNRKYTVGSLGEGQLFHKLSSGERSWLDMALAQAAAALVAVGDRSAWVAGALGRLSDEELLDAAMAVHYLDSIEQDWWSPEDLGTALALMERLFDSASAALLGNDPEVEDVMRTVMAFAQPELRPSFDQMLTIHLFDEPERHLSPGAQRHAQHALSDVSSADVAVATHSHTFLGGNGWAHVHLSTTPEGSVATSFDPDQLNLMSPVSVDMGLTRGELLTRYRYVLFVEGLVDGIVLEGLYQLDRDGILLLPIYGVDEVLSLSELRLIGHIVDTPTGLLVDHAKVSRIRGPRPSNPTKEEEALRDLLKVLARRGRKLDLFGLQLEDIIGYLDESSLQAEAPAFPGWEDFDRLRQPRESFKSAIERLAEVQIRRSLVRRVVQRMAADGRPARRDLPTVVAQIIAAASTE